MATNYPGSIDSLTNPSAGDALTSPSHSAQHANANDAIEAIETELGVNPSGSDATVAARLTAIEAGTNLATGAVTSAKIADGAIATADLADAAVTYAKLGSDVRIGNLLTANAASIETDASAWTSGGGSPTIARSTAKSSHGSASLLVTATGTGGWLTLASPRISVTAGETYTGSAEFASSSGTRTYRVGVLFYDAASGGTIIGDAYAAYATPSASFTGQSFTAVVPTGATHAVPLIDTNSTGSIGDAVHIDKIGFWRGASGVWAMPGIPIVHTGIRPNPANTAQVQIWNEATATWITV